MVLRFILPLVLIVGSMILYMSAFIVKEWDKAIVLQFGEIMRTDFKPGLHFLVPLLQNVKKYDSRILTLDAEPREILTKEKKNVKVDSFIKWRIVDLEKYYKAVGGSEASATLVLSPIIKKTLADELGKRTIQEAISGERSQIMDVISTNAKEKAQEYGIELVDVRIKRIDLPDGVSESVFLRMESERKRVAKELRSKGAEAAERIRADADRKYKILVSEAYRDAESIRGDGDAKASKVYADAYKTNPEFYAFYRSLSAYKETFATKNDVIVMQPSSDFFKYYHDLKKNK